MFMDRYTTNIAKSKIGFIDFIIKPSFESVLILLPKINRSLQSLEINKQEWEKKIEDYQPKK